VIWEGEGRSISLGCPVRSTLGEALHFIGRMGFPEDRRPLPRNSLQIVISFRETGVGMTRLSSLSVENKKEKYRTGTEVQAGGKRKFISVSTQI